MATFWENAAPSVNHNDPYVLFERIMSNCYFTFWFRGKDFSSDCASTWSLHINVKTFHSTDTLMNVVDCGCAETTESLRIISLQTLC